MQESKFNITGSKTIIVKDSIESHNINEALQIFRQVHGNMDNIDVDMPGFIGVCSECGDAIMADTDYLLPTEYESTFRLCEKCNHERKIYKELTCKTIK